MTGRVAVALREQRDQLLAVCRTLTPDEWAAPSDCAGWRVQDVVAHIASLAHGFVAPWVLRPARGAEAINDRLVEIRRNWGPQQVLAEYETWVDRQLAVLSALQRPVLGSIPIPLPSLGIHPLRMLGNAGAFDTHLHVRHDILAPAGPIDRSVPPTSAATMQVILEWMLAGLPQMNRENLSWVSDPIAVELTGPGGGTWSVSRGRGRTLSVTRDDECAADTRIVGSGLDFEVWSTRRRDWRDFDVSLVGNTDAASRFCDSLDII